MRARVVARADPAAAHPQRADDAVQQRHNGERAECQHQRAILQCRPPGKHAHVVAGVEPQPVVDQPEVRRRRRERDVSPPVAGSQREQNAEDETEQESAAEQHLMRDRFHDLEVAQAARHLHRADRAIDDEKVAGRPGHGRDEGEGLQHQREVAGVDQRRPARKCSVPRPIRRLNGQPPAAHQGDHQQDGAGHVESAATGAGHAFMPCSVSQPSTSARYASRDRWLVASKRMTSTGWVLDARNSPHPSGKVMRTPSSVKTG